MLGQALRRAAAKGYLSVLKEMLEDKELREKYLIKYREPKNWIEKAYKKAETYPEIQLYLEQFIITEE